VALAFLAFGPPKPISVTHVDVRVTMPKYLTTALVVVGITVLVFIQTWWTAFVVILTSALSAT
jgi:hypothetical protein